MPTVLVIDDDPNVCELVALYCTREGIEVRAAADGEAGLSSFRHAGPDLVVLDLMLPGQDGLAVCQDIRRQSEVPIIMLTAKGEEADRVLGLELGADDYVAKPFSPRELVARIKAVLRRVRTPAAPSEAPMEFPGLTLDLGARTVRVAGQPVPFTPREFDLLTFLATRPQKVFTRDQLLQLVWGYEFVGDQRTVDVHVKKVRQKLAPGGAEYIRTVWGVGYKFEAPT